MPQTRAVPVTGGRGWERERKSRLASQRSDIAFVSPHFCPREEIPRALTPAECSQSGQNEEEARPALCSSWSELGLHPNLYLCPAQIRVSGSDVLDGSQSWSLQWSHAAEPAAGRAEWSSAGRLQSPDLGEVERIDPFLCFTSGGLELQSHAVIHWKNKESVLCCTFSPPNHLVIPQITLWDPIAGKDLW